MKLKSIRKKEITTDMFTKFGNEIDIEDNMLND